MGESLPEARENVRRELGACLGDLALAAAADLDREEATEPDIRALLEAERAPDEEEDNSLPPALR